LLLTLAADAKWAMEDEVERRRKALQDAEDYLASLTDDFDYFISAAEAKGIDTRPYYERRAVRWLPQLIASYVLSLVSGALSHASLTAFRHMDVQPNDIMIMM
jgi:hypothetical protein